MGIIDTYKAGKEYPDLKRKYEVLEKERNKYKAIYDNVIKSKDKSMPFIAKVLSEYEGSLDKYLHEYKDVYANHREIYLRREVIYYKNILIYLSFHHPEVLKEIEANQYGFEYGFYDLHGEENQAKKIFNLAKQVADLKDALSSNLKAIPYISAIFADFETYGIELIAKELDYGYSQKRREKTVSIREIRKSAKEMVERNLESKYQLEYMLQLFPALQTIIETDYNDLPIVNVDDLSEYDRASDWLSKEEYQSLSNSERNQLALDRYKASHNKSKWQVGRDYELYIGHTYEQKGYKVDYFGSYMGLEDLGRDLIVKKGDSVSVVQCKYWSKEKVIHEKHITQLYGTMMCYCLENKLPKSSVNGVLVTNIKLSDTAKKMAEMLKITFKEDTPMSDYPCIKCNIGKDEYGGQTKIYHLPFDQQYDATKIDSPGEFFAVTVKEAEDAGFRRAFKFFGNG